MRIQHGRVLLELHELRGGSGPRLLLLHGLRGASTDWGELPAAWPGAVCALDFCGHGQSDWVAGGVYYPELLLGDADAALAAVGEATLIGAGIGAYVALLLAGARATRVPAALLLPGAGLAGGGALPDFHREFPRLTPLPAGARTPGMCDPMVETLEHDVRPVEYVESFAGAARRLLLFADGEARPPWWEAARGGPTAETVSGDVRAAVERLRACAAAA
jgi:pimeloyl-ACP methyl ester carboxylesterase